MPPLVRHAERREEGGKEGGKRRERERERQRDRETERQTDRQTDRETDRQTDRQREREREREEVPATDVTASPEEVEGAPLLCRHLVRTLVETGHSRYQASGGTVAPVSRAVAPWWSTFQISM